MGYPQSQVPNTAHSVWYAYSIHVGGTPIASFERFGARSTRTVERIREILFSRGPETAEIVWGGTDSTVDLSYVELYQKQCFEVFGKEIYALEDMTSVFTVTEVMTMPAAIGGYRVIDYVDCVAQAWGRDLDVSGSKVVETMTIEVRKVQGRRSS